MWHEIPQLPGVSMTMPGFDGRVSLGRLLGLRRRDGLRAVALLLVLGAPIAARAGSTVDWKDGGLTVRAEYMPLASVLAEVARRTGIRIVGAQDLHESVTLGFSEVSLEDGLRRLLAGRSYVIIIDPTALGKTLPIEVWLLGRGASGAAGMTGEGEDSSRGPGRLAAGSEATADDPPGARLRGFLADPDPAIRRFAVERLGEVGEPWALSRLVVALNDESAGVREKAVTALGEYGPDGVDPVLMLLEVETHPDVRVAVAELLGRLAGPRGVSALEGMLVDSDPEVRRAAVHARALARGGGTNEALLAAALDHDAAVRTAALNSLGIFGAETDPVAAIKDALARDDQAVQAAAASLAGPLGQLGFLENPGHSATVSDTAPAGSPSEPR